MAAPGEPGAPSAMSVQRLKRVLVGRPIPTSLDQHERLSRVTGLAVFASDALSSVAYATEEILLVLVAGRYGGARLLAADRARHRGPDRDRGHLLPADDPRLPAGRRRLHRDARTTSGRYPSLVAGAALLIDYVLTVAVSVAAGDRRAHLGVPAALRRTASCCACAGGPGDRASRTSAGVRESGSSSRCRPISSSASLVGMIAVGASSGGSAGDGGAAPRPSAEPRGRRGADASSSLLRAFASGCTALTGVEAVSDGVPAFRPPEAQNARQRARVARPDPDRRSSSASRSSPTSSTSCRRRGDDRLPARPAGLRAARRSTT